MSFPTVCRVAGVKRGDVGRLTAHNARQGHIPAHVDRERIKDNQVLIGSGKPADDLRAAIEGIAQARAGKTPADEYIGAEIILSAKADYFKTLDEAGLQKWVDHSVEWLKSQQTGPEPKGKLVSVILHKDEEAPHLHAVYAPIVEISRRHPVTKEQMPAKPVLAYSKLYGDTFTALAAARKAGRSHTDTKLGRMQTSYAEAVKDCGLIRGKESMRTERDIKHVAPHLYREIKGQLDKSQEQIAALEQQRKMLEKKVQILNTNWKDVKEKTLSSWDDEIKELRTIVNDLEKKQESLEKKQQSLTREVTHLNNERLTHEKELPVLKKEIDTFRQACEQEKKRLDEFKANFNRQWNEGTIRWNSATANLAAREQQVTGLNEAISGLQKQAEGLKGEVQSRREENISLKAENDALRANNAALKIEGEASRFVQSAIQKIVAEKQQAQQIPQGLTDTDRSRLLAIAAQAAQKQEQERREQQQRHYTMSR